MKALIFASDEAESGLEVIPVIARSIESALSLMALEGIDGQAYDLLASYELDPKIDYRELVLL